MKKHIFYLTLVLLFSISFSQAQVQTRYLSKLEIESDLRFLDSIFKNRSSYQGLNGFDYKKDFDNYLQQIGNKKISLSDFGLFLSNTIGKIGDRHSYIKGYDLPEKLYFPLSFAPFKNKVLVLSYNKAKKKYTFWNSNYPYLKSINTIPIEKILHKILPNEKLAPKQSYSLRVIRKLRDVETVFSILNVEMPNPLPITLTNESGVEKQINVDLATDETKGYLWDERFHKKNFYFSYRKENLKDKEIIKQFFSIKDNIAYIQIVDMLGKDDSPVFFQHLTNFMKRAKETDALIVDVRDNGGGTRDLIQELAGYFTHPDSIYVVNATKQRGNLPLKKNLKRRLHSRYLYSRDELNINEQKAVDKFMNSFNPMYNLDKKKFSEYHYYVFNGQKITKDKFHYNKPIYILANERSFSAASVLVSVFKNLGNIKVVGVNTDGSSGNSQRFKLPNSKLRGKISTMVSFQKNGKILDGIGTKPDIRIERNLEQIFMKEDYQLKKLIEIIKTK